MFQKCISGIRNQFLDPFNYNWVYTSFRLCLYHKHVWHKMILKNYQEPGTRNREPGTGNQEPGTGNQEPGTGNEEPGTGNREPGTGNREPGTNLTLI